MAVKTISQAMERNLKSEVSIRLATQRDLDRIFSIIDAEASRSGAVDRVSKETLTKWISICNSYVAEDPNGAIVGHRAVLTVNSEWAELRSAVVNDSYRGNGVGYKLAEALLDGFVKNNPNIKYIISVKNEASNGRGILVALGFEKMERNEGLDKMLSIPNEDRWELFALDAEKYRLKSSARS